MRFAVIGGRTLGKEPCLVATALADSAVEMARQSRRAVTLGADLVELRVDRLPDAEAVARTIRGESAPHIVACRSPRFGGFFSGTEDERVARLEDAIRAGSAAVDIEYFTEPQLRSRVVASARAQGVPVLIGYENMQETPSYDEMIRGLNEVAALEPDLVKLAVRAQSHADLVQVLQVALAAHVLLEVPFAVIALGACGAPSRPLACVLGASFTYCAMEGGSVPGQLTLKETRDVIALLSERRWPCSSS
jgi:3-dehydroquinate dehydratase type I